LISRHLVDGDARLPSRGTALALMAAIMMRVTRIGTSGHPVLRVEGRLTQQTLEELRMECAVTLASDGPLALDLAGLQFADAAGVSLLLELERVGARLEHRTGLVEALLHDPVQQGPASPVPGPAADALLVERLRAGDAEAFEALVREFGGRMLTTARRMVPGEDDARDVVQDALLSAFRAIHAFEGSARLSTWLHRIVVNAALMRLRSTRRRREESIDELLPRFDDDGHFAEPVVRWEGETDALVERAEIRALVRAAVDLLPEMYRTVLVMRDIEELDTEETAEALGITPNAVKTRLHRARQALRALLAKDFAGARSRTDGPRGA
jgi:RNA polymerase sigma-70 factor (ECF subfamily)